MTLKERIVKEESKLGKILKNWVATFLLVCSALGAANEFLAVLPPDFVPIWVKTAIVVAGIISFVAGKLTTKKNEQTPNQSN